MVVAEDEREMLKKIISSELMAPSWRDERERWKERLKWRLIDAQFD